MILPIPADHFRLPQPRTQGALRFSTLRFQLVKTIDSPGYEVEVAYVNRPYRHTLGKKFPGEN